MRSWSLRRHQPETVLRFAANCQEIKKSEEVIVAKSTSIGSTYHSTTCRKCGNVLSMPEWSEFVSESLVFNFWSCMACGNRFETGAFAPADKNSKIDDEVLEEFLPSLLVA
jgi:ribosomal protein L37AE/L43A